MIDRRAQLEVLSKSLNELTKMLNLCQQTNWQSHFENCRLEADQLLANGFDQNDLFRRIEKAKARGVFVALSLDGSKKSGATDCDYDIPHSLFEKHVAVNCGRSMLKRFQMGGKTLEGEVVTDRLLLTH